MLIPLHLSRTLLSCVAATPVSRQIPSDSHCGDDCVRNAVYANVGGYFWVFDGAAAKQHSAHVVR
jgi:hypothetical protein